MLDSSVGMDFTFQPKREFEWYFFFTDSLSTQAAQLSTPNKLLNELLATIRGLKNNI